MKPVWTLCAWWLALLALAAAPAQAQSLRARMLMAEDARNPEAGAIAPLLEGLRSPDPALVRQAVRALGRFERPEFAAYILPLLAAARPELRRDAADAAGQAVASARRELP